MLILWRAFTVYSTLSVISSSMSGRNCNWTRNLIMKRIKVENMSKKVWNSKKGYEIQFDKTQREKNKI